MLVYGDRSGTETPAGIVDRIAARLDECAAEPAGIRRHEGLTEAWMEAASLLQGVADAEFAARGYDDGSTAQRAVTALLMACARALVASWRGGFRGGVQPALARLPRTAAALPPDPVRIVEPEGHAFYALYPEAYLRAAAALAGEPEVRVIGLRSIGTGLAAIVAAALGAPDPITVRPVGGPFARKLALGPDLRAGIAAARDAVWAIADEGPGLSGSSFAAAHDALAAEGVARVHYFPGHAGEPGGECSAANRLRWRQTPRHVSDFADWAIAHAPERQGLANWVADLTGASMVALQDIGAGRWRALRYGSEQVWPPVWAAQERRKYLLITGSGGWLLKFAGLGRAAPAKTALARRLSEAGFTPPVAGWRYGFLVERWIDARPLGPDFPRAALIAHLGRYLGFRATHCPAPQPGASLDALAAMAARNVGLALGENAARKIAHICDPARALQSALVPVAIDGRLQRWEWLVLADGKLLKADAVDHHASHDLVGCQEIIWDIAGAAVEFGLDAHEEAELCRAVEQASGRAVLRALLPMMRLCYAAFQLGRATYAEQGSEGGDRMRNANEIARYRAALTARLAG